MKQNLFFTGLLALMMMLSHEGWGQLLIQDFSSSSTVSDYVSTTPNNTQFNAISSSGAGTTVSIVGEKLSFARTGNAGSFSRTTDFDPVPTTLQYKVTISVSGNTVAQTTAAVFQVGSGFGTANSAEANASTYARFGINFTATNGTWTIRDVTGGTNSSDLTGSQDITWVLNNSGAGLTYLSPANTYETIDNDKADIWAGTTRLFNDVSIQTTTQTIADLKFAFTAGSGTITVDNFLIDPIPVVWLNNQSSNSWNTSTNWGYGSVPSSTQNVIIPSGGDQPIVNNNAETPAIISKLTINSGATLTVGEGKALTVSGTLTNSAGASGLVIESDATGTGSLIHSTASVPGTVQRHVVSHGNVATDGWHLIGSPVATFTINGSSFDPGTNDDLYAWDEATNTWLNHKVGNPTQIVPGTGYIVAYENTGTKSFTGNLNVSNVAVSGLAHTAAQGKGWHLLGNPFASALEWNKTGGSWALTNVAGTAKVWNSATKAYVDVVADGIIPSAQGFFVQVNESTTGSLTIPAAARAHSSTAWYKNTTPRLMLSASPTDGSSRQESQIRIEPEATSSFDFYYDSRFLPGYAPQFYSMSDGELLSSNALPQVQNGASIPLGFVKNQHEYFVIRMEENNIGETILIKDLKLNLTHNLSQQPEYHFTSAQGDDPNRFLLHFGAVGVDEALPTTVVAAYVSNNILYVLNAQGKVQVDVLDLSGRMVYSQSMQAEGLSSTPINLSAGVYVVRLNDGQTTMANKVIVQ